MNAEQLSAWRERMGYSKTKAAEALGTSRNSLAAWEESVYPVPLYIELACKFLALEATLPGALRSALEQWEKQQ